MESVTLILQIGSVAAAITAIIVLAVKIVSVVKKIYNFIHNMETNVATLLRHDDAQYKAILRLIITADHMPMSERLLAGKEYVEEMHGNGDVKAIYNELKVQCAQVGKDN